MSEYELLVSATIVNKNGKIFYSQPKSLPLNKNVHSLRILREGAHGPWRLLLVAAAPPFFLFPFFFSNHSSQQAGAAQ